MIILICGLPGSGKTTLAQEIEKKTPSIILNADQLRAGLNSDLGFSLNDRIENARRIGEVAKLISDQGHLVLADFICPTPETRTAFGHLDHVVWVNRIEKSTYEDTNRMWVPPTEVDHLTIDNGLTPGESALLVIKHFSIPNWTDPHTLMLGRYQPWHEGHETLASVGSNGDRVVVGVRNTHLTSDKDPFDFNQVHGFISSKNPEHLVVRFPNITRIIYGRDVGYSIEKIELDANIESISATQKRKEMNL